VLYDVSTLYFETDAGDGFREPGFSKERRQEPQITIGLLTDASGFPLMVEAFEGNAAETTTMLPTITAFMAAHRLADVTVAADAGMISAANMRTCSLFSVESQCNSDRAGVGERRAFGTSTCRLQVCLTSNLILGVDDGRVEGAIPKVRPGLAPGPRQGSPVRAGLPGFG
jgi:hypothetical protein